jgi:hypothetical protein
LPLASKQAFLSKSVAIRGRIMDDLNHRPDAALEDVIEPVLPFLPPGDIRSLRAASHRVKEAIHDRSPDMLILGERRLPTMMGVKHFWIEDDEDHDEDHEDDDGGQEWVRVYQIQKFRFALSVESDLVVDEECKLTSSIIVVEVALHNHVWGEAGNNQVILPPSSCSSETGVVIDISIIPKRREGYHSPHLAGRRHHIFSTRFTRREDHFVSCREYHRECHPSNLPRCPHCDGFKLYFPFTGYKHAGTGLARFEPQLRLTMAILHECFKRIESFPDETSYPSAGFLMWQLPEALHRYFPNEFDREIRPCRDRNLIVVEFEYRRARTLREWREEWHDHFAGRSSTWMEEYDLNGPRSIPWYHDDYDQHSRLLDDEDCDDNEDD